MWSCEQANTTIETKQGWKPTEKSEIEMQIDLYNEGKGLLDGLTTFCFSLVPHKLLVATLDSRQLILDVAHSPGR